MGDKIRILDIPEEYKWQEHNRWQLIIRRTLIVADVEILEEETVEE